MGKSDQSGRDVGPETSSAARDANDSFVKKMTSRVSELIPNTLSRWFSSQRPLVRRRESSSSSNDDDDDEPSSKRPPTKRPCLPADRKRYADATSIGYRLANGSTVADRAKPDPPKQFANYEDATEGRFLKLYERSPDTETSVDDGAGTSVGTRASALRAELERTARKAVSGYERSDETANGAEKSESEDSTSGCSSMAQRNRPERSEEVFETRRRRYDPSPNVSSERSLFTKLNLRADSLASSRRPSFDVSSFGSPSLVDRTLTSERIANSPFYKGITRFGGASAALRHTPRPDRRPRIAVDVRPAKDAVGSDAVELSKTARRILDALEHVSSPIDDVRNMPCPNITRDRPRTPYSRMHAPPATKPLVIPTVCDLLRMKRVDELRESTETVRDITARTEPIAKVRSFDLPEYKLRSDDTTKRSSKIRPKISKVRGVRTDANEYSERVELPEVSLKIESMPKFDIAILAPKPPVGQFRFASPSDVFVGSVAPAQHKNTAADDTFEFSAPIYVDEFDRKRKRTPSPVLKRRPLSSVKAGESIERNSIIEVPADDEKRPVAAPAKATWECDTCMIANETTDETRCVACKAPRPGSSLPSERPFEDWFKSQSDKWKCGVCLVRNAMTDSKCIACTTERPGTAKPQEKQQQQPRDKDVTKAPTGFGDAFKPPADTWSCDVCLIRNKSGADLCAACDSPRPGAKPSKPAVAKVVEWECPTCAVRNADSSHECVCCRSMKPGSRPKVVEVPGGAPPIGAFKFGIDKAGVDVKETVASPPSGFVFGKTDATATTVSTAGFTFGIPAGEKKADASTAGKFTFGIPAPPVEKTTKDVSDETDSTSAARESNEDTPTEEKPETVAEKPTEQVSKDTESGSFAVPKKDGDMKSTNNNNRFTFGSSEVVVSNVTVSTVDKEATSTGTKTDKETENVKQPSPEPTTQRPIKSDVETVKAATSTGPAETERPSVVAPAFVKPAPQNQFAFGVPSNTPPSSSKTLLFGSEPTAAPVPAFVAKPQLAVEPEKNVFGGDTPKPADKPFMPESQPFQSSSSTTDMFSNAKPLFGSCLTPSFRRCTKPVFGSTEPAQPPASAGSSGTFLKPSTNGYAFDTASPAENKPSPPPLFTFGAAAAAAATNDDSKPAKVQKFPFSAGPAAAAPTFSFGGGAETKPFASFPFGGGGKTDRPSFGNVSGAAAPSPMFGSTPAAAAGGTDPFAGFGATSKTPMFNFGAGAAQSPAKIFSFGNPQASAPAASASAGTTAFTFGAQSSPAPPSFDPNTKPMFNFSGSSAPTAFTARPAPGTTPAVAQRKVKRAVRRTQR